MTAFARLLSVSIAAAVVLVSADARAAIQALPACAAASEPMAWAANTNAAGLIADIDATPLRERRIWIDAETSNAGVEPLNLRLVLSFDPKADGSMTFGQDVELFVPAGATRHTVLTAWVRPGVANVGVLADSVNADVARHVSLHLRCASEIARGGRPSSEQALLEEALKLYFDNALRAPLDEASLRHEAQGLATGAVDRNDIAWAVRAVMIMAGDRHSYIVPPAERGAFYGSMAPSPPRVEMRANGLALVAVSQVGFDGDENARRGYARGLHEAVARVARRHPSGWIVDLRGDHGGDMWPMLAGLSALVDGPFVGEFVSRDGVEPWLVASGRAGMVVKQDMVSIGAQDEPAIVAPVAVLIGPGTGSSGEMTAIAFERRPNSRFFGQATLGTYNSVVQQHTLSDGTLFGIVQALGADRTGHVYEGPIVPDVLVGEGDDPVKAAAAWLLSAQHGARRSVAR